ncbi:hypothetical protein QAD02_011129 [Eretmocerus hayati]|uniref:Uncharacterized protein n=1 Tax=Eretmocerus hayati TaxID=131215 RepID=A0ACC2NWW1_9HYME|nr:hypothetical protein QAD02_011129 [Eretmocerus hayati]
MIMCGTFAIWFWTLDKNTVTKYAVAHSIARNMRYHLGTVGLGSLLVAIFRFIRILWYLLKGLARKSFGYCCCEMWVAAIKEFVKMITNNAYIVCANHGTNFIQSARFGYNLLERNVDHVIMIYGVKQVILYVGQLLIVGFSVVTAYASFRSAELAEKRITSPIIIVTVGSIIVTRVVSKIASTAIDTIFLCALEDNERNDGSNNRPYYMNLNLRVLFLESRLEDISNC